MEKRVFFKGWWLPALLVAPQLLISFVFFFYPSGQAIWNSLFLPDPFGLKTEFVGLDNFKFLLSDPYYLASFKTDGNFFNCSFGFINGFRFILSSISRSIN